MSRFTHRQYQRHLAVTMLLYVGSMLLVWPLARSIPQLSLKALFAVVPAVPMLYVIVLIARRVISSDEMEQRAHLLALGVATGVVGALSMVAGLLAAAGVLPLEGDILVWVFPVSMISYGIAHLWILTRRYGGTTECEAGDAWSIPVRLGLVALLMGIIAFVSWWQGRLGDTRLGMLIGMTLSLAAASAFWGIRALRRRMRMPAGDSAEIR